MLPLYYIADESLLRLLKERYIITPINEININLLIKNLNECTSLHEAFEWCFIRNEYSTTLKEKIVAFMRHRYGELKIREGHFLKDIMYNGVSCNIQVSDGMYGKCDFTLYKNRHYLLICYTPEKVHVLYLEPHVLNYFLDMYGLLLFPNDMNFTNREYSFHFRYTSELWNILLEYEITKFN
jgi:hypothetical protein